MNYQLLQSQPDKQFRELVQVFGLLNWISDHLSLPEIRLATVATFAIVICSGVVASFTSNLGQVNVISGASQVFVWGLPEVKNWCNSFWSPAFVSCDIILNSFDIN